MISEREIESYFAKQAVKRGYLSHKLAPTVKGLPDRILLTPDGVIFVELKSPKGKVSQAQKLIHAQIKKVTGSSPWILKSRSEVDLFFALLDRKLTVKEATDFVTSLDR